MAGGEEGDGVVVDEVVRQRRPVCGSVAVSSRVSRSFRQGICALARQTLAPPRDDAADLASEVGERGTGADPVGRRDPGGQVEVARRVEPAQRVEIGGDGAREGVRVRHAVGREGRPRDHVVGEADQRVVHLLHRARREVGEALGLGLGRRKHVREEGFHPPRLEHRRRDAPLRPPTLGGGDEDAVSEERAQAAANYVALVVDVDGVEKDALHHRRVGDEDKVWPQRAALQVQKRLGVGGFRPRGDRVRPQRPEEVPEAGLRRKGNGGRRAARGGRMVGEGGAHARVVPVAAMATPAERQRLVRQI